MKISLITTTFNSDSTLRDTFQSVLLQSYTDIEYIVIDGLSMDRTVDIIKEYEPLFSGRMKWVSEKDNGLYDAMNKGVRMATGDVIGTLNSDDFFTSNSILKSVSEVMERENIDAVYGDVHFVNSANLDKIIRYYSSRIFKRSLMKFGLMPAHPTFYCRKDCFERYGLYKTGYKICADFDLLLRFIYVNNMKTKYIPLDMVTMRIGGASTNGIQSHLCIMREQLRSFKENKIKSNRLLLSLRYLYKLTEFIRI